MDTDPVRSVLRAQGRQQKWLAEQLGITPNYLHRILLGPDHEDGRAAPEWFYTRVARVLGVPEAMLRAAASDEARAAA